MIWHIQIAARSVMAWSLAFFVRESSRLGGLVVTVASALCSNLARLELGPTLDHAVPTVSSPDAEVVYIRRHKLLQWANGGVEVVIGGL